jgi:hypothetical protein
MFTVDQQPIKTRRPGDFGRVGFGQSQSDAGGQIARDLTGR